MLSKLCVVLLFLDRLSFLRVDSNKVNCGQVSLKTGDGGLEDGHREADDGEDDEHVEGARGEVREVQHGVEQLVACTHGEEDPPVGIIKLHPVVAGGVNELVAGGALQEGGVDMEPVARDVNSHGELEQEHEARVEGGEGGQQTHRGAPVSQHVQHGSELAALPQKTSGVAINSVQKSGDDVTPGGGHVVSGHEPEAEQSQSDPPVPDQVGHKHEHVLGLGELAE